MKCTPEQLEEIKQNSKFVKITGLPSLFIPYIEDGLTELYIKPFELPELTLLSKAAALGTYHHLIRAVDNCISYDINKIGIGDFWFIMFWLRTNSFPKTPYTLAWNCNSPFFKNKETGEYLYYKDVAKWNVTVEQLETEHEATPCGTANASPINRESLTIKELDEDFILPEGFDFPRVAIMDELEEALKDTEQTFLAPGIQWLPGLTWDEKIRYANENPAELMEGLKLNRQVVYGIVETAKVMCRNCTVSHEFELELNAINFFQQ